METIKKQEKLHTILIAILLVPIFAWLFFMGDYGIAGDSESFMTMGVTREPLYPIFVLIFRKLFGENGFYIPLALAQNILAYLSVVIVADYFGKKVFQNRIGQWISAIILLMPHLMTPIFSRSHLVMTNKIMSEGITLPGYYLFVLFLVKIIYEEEHFWKNAMILSGISAALVLARGQMMLTIIILIIVIGIRLIVEKQIQKIYIPIVIGVCIFIGTGLVTKVYNYSNTGHFVGTASSKPMILANALYVSEENDGQNITDAKYRKIFEEVYAALDEDQMLYKYAEGNAVDKALHHEDYHDTISFDYFEPIKNDIYYETDDNSIIMKDGYAAYMLEQDEIAGAITKDILASNWTRYLSNYLNVCILGFIRSVAVDHPVLNIYAAGIYIVGLVLLAVTWRKKRFTKEVYLLGMTYVMIAGFVTATSLFLQCITRYMIYNLPFFYIAGVALLFSWFPKKKDGVREIS